MAKTKIKECKKFSKCNRGHKTLTLSVIVTEYGSKKAVLDETVEDACNFLHWLIQFGLPLFMIIKIEQLRKNNTPERIRTSNLRFRRPPLGL